MIWPNEWRKRSDSEKLSNDGICLIKCLFEDINHFVKEKTLVFLAFDLKEMDKMRWPRMDADFSGLIRVIRVNQRRKHQIYLVTCLMLQV
jgi:hypothetical protein